MPRIEILPTYETGHPDIDGDHKRLAEILNRLNETIAAGDLKECRGLFDWFIKEATEHFKVEEDILAETNFPRLEQHSAYHAELLKRAETVKDMCRDEIDVGRLAKCFNDLAEFMVDDIVRGDLDFKSFLEEAVLKTEKRGEP